MAWFVLIVSGVLESGWAIALKKSEGFTRLGPSVTFGVLAMVSFGGLAWAMKTLPAGPSYAVWTGIGAALTATLGILLFNEAVSAVKLVSIGLIIAGVTGLALTGGGH
ncbi:DMT family transporter [Stigmatella aurantiaca]|uniref:Small multidrug resistance protein, SMR family n=1 Tax=Stigmatella aurantiaca (strain DW4/3-1) TaxID=378806 RepID=Q08WX3_STIAD|nr:multidrug efflux SMR transporter [Stigmatella aurantiaca]ADO70879.1 Small multidrug resistance protein, SMR family [Stigmatella aurantiaca DW4/3-1]EAU64985.1 SugE [Stigmatella aurantiaca DW4/3-1]